MNINDLTLGQAKELAAMLGQTTGGNAVSHIGKKCIIRTYASGVHFGTVIAQHDRQVEIANARRLWRWHARSGISLSDVSQVGIEADKCRICAVVPTMTVLDALEIIPATEVAQASIEQAPVAAK